MRIEKETAINKLEMVASLLAEVRLQLEVMTSIGQAVQKRGRDSAIKKIEEVEMNLPLIEGYVKTIDKAEFLVKDDKGQPVSPQKL